MYINRITVEMGYKCNGNCNYCFQKQYKKEEQAEINGTELLCFLTDLYKNQLITEKTEIMFFGGEALLYLDQIIYIIKEMKQKGIFFIPKITTNGILLSEQNIPILLEYKIQPTISIDGSPNIQELERHQHPNYQMIQYYNDQCKHNKISTTCQSTITPKTIGNLFESFLVVNALHFTEWWYELEQIQNKWNTIFYHVYEQQVKQIYEYSKFLDVLVIPFQKVIDAFNNKEIIERTSIYISAEGNISSGGMLINRLNKDYEYLFRHGNLTNYNLSDMIKKLQLISPFAGRTAFPESEKCQNCIMNNRCLRNLENELSGIEFLQNDCNCASWYYLQKAIKEVNNESK